MKLQYREFNAFERIRDKTLYNAQPIKDIPRRETKI